jgi:DNA-binding MltR family transcriptional regulator
LCDRILNKLLTQDNVFSSREEAPSILVEELDILVKEAVGAL